MVGYAVKKTEEEEDADAARQAAALLRRSLLVFNGLLDGVSWLIQQTKKESL